MLRMPMRYHRHGGLHFIAIGRLRLSWCWKRKPKHVRYALPHSEHCYDHFHHEVDKACKELFQ